MIVASDDRDENCSGDDVSHYNRDEGETDSHSAEVPLLVYEGEGLNEDKNESVSEAAEQK